QQDLEERHAAPVRRVAVADASARRVTDAAGLRGALRSAAGARGIVFGRIRQDGEFVNAIHLSILRNCSRNSSQRGGWQRPRRARGYRMSIGDLTFIDK